MNAKDFQKECLRTEFTPTFALNKDGSPDPVLSRLLHAAMGMVTEAAEVVDMLKKHIAYGKPLDLVNVVEECGDQTYYQNIALDAVGVSPEEAFDRVSAKLRARYPEGFTPEKALNRDLKKEREILEGRTSIKNVLFEEAKQKWPNDRLLDMGMDTGKRISNQNPENTSEDTADIFGTTIKPIYLYKNIDLSGVSGTGVVAVGAIMPSGRVILEWLGKYKTETIFSSIEELYHIHAHYGATEIIFGNPKFHDLLLKKGSLNIFKPNKKASKET